MRVLRCSLVLCVLLAGALAAAELRTADDAVLTSGTTPNDTAGNPVSAHEGWLMVTAADSFFWYGTGPKRNASSSDGSTWDWVSDSISVYTSHDLSSWKPHVPAFTADALPRSVQQRLTQGVDQQPLRLERPKVLYNAQRRYYVLLFHVDSLARGRAEVGWAVSVSPTGPFKFEASRRASNVSSWDITVASDGDSAAWLVQAVPQAGLAISPLAADFLDTTGVCARIPAPAPAVAAGAPGQVARRPLQHVQQQQQHWQQQQQQQQGRQQQQAVPQLAGSTLNRLRALQPALQALARVLAGPGALYARLAAMYAGLWAAAAPAAAAAAAAAEAGSIPNKPPLPAAAPCLFKYNGRWYLLAVTKASWRPSAPLLYVNDDSPCNQSAWRALPSPVSSGPKEAALYDSVPAFVFPYTFADANKVLLLYFGDRYAAAAAGGPANASYVYLPLVAGDAADTLQLVYVPSVRLSDYRQVAVSV